MQLLPLLAQQLCQRSAPFLTSCLALPPASCSLQGNVDPVVLFGSEAAIEAAVRDCLTKAGERGHVLNLGHGVLVGTPEVRKSWAGATAMECNSGRSAWFPASSLDGRLLGGKRQRSLRQLQSLCQHHCLVCQARIEAVGLSRLLKACRARGLPAYPPSPACTSAGQRGAHV